MKSNLTGTGRPNTIAGRLARRGSTVHDGDATVRGDVPGLQPASQPDVIGELRNVMVAIEHAVTKNGFGEHYVPKLVAVSATQTKVASRNPARRKLQVWTDASNTVPVWIGPSAYNGSQAPAAGDGFVALAPGSAILELSAWGAVYAWSSAAAFLHAIEEYGL